MLSITQSHFSEISFLGVFPKLNGNSVNSANSGNLTNHWSMNLGQFKDPDSQMCLASTVVVSCSLMQEVTDSSPFTVITNISITEFAEFSEKI